MRYYPKLKSKERTEDIAQLYSIYLECEVLDLNSITQLRKRIKKGKKEGRKQAIYFACNKLKGMVKIFRRVNEISECTVNIMISQLSWEYIIVVEKREKTKGRWEYFSVRGNCIEIMTSFHYLCHHAHGVWYLWLHFYSCEVGIVRSISKDHRLRTSIYRAYEKW